MHKYFFTISCFLAAITVMLGAFGAHALKAMIDEHSLLVYDTAVRYEFYHVFAMMISSLVAAKKSNKFIRLAFWFFLIGIFFFSGSLYLITYKVAMGISGLNWAGPITPLGGLCFIIGWILLGVGGKTVIFSGKPE